MKTLINTLTAVLVLAFTMTVSKANAIDLFDNFGDLDKADTSVIFGYGSAHYDDAEWMNESNPAFGIEMWDLSVVYVSKNSFENTSFYVTYAPDFYESKYVTISGNFGFATGYHKEEIVVKGNETYTARIPTWMGLAPLAGITVKGHVTDHLSVTATITYNVAMLGGEYKF